MLNFDDDIVTPVVAHDQPQITQHTQPPRPAPRRWQATARKCTSKACP
jgi:hypothetical protein